jgi:hypothetical protein
MAKRKLENGEQRPAPETYPARAEIPKIADQRPGRASPTRAGSHTPLFLQLDFGHLDGDVVSRPLIIKISEHNHRNDKRPDNCYCEWFHQGILQFEFFRPLHLIPVMRDPTWRDPVTRSRPLRQWLDPAA